MINALWPVWVTASVNKHFVDNISELNVRAEGQEKNPDALSNIVEVRVDGPKIHEETKGQYTLRFEVNCVINLKYENGTNIYQVQQDIGKVAAAYKNISVFKFGPTSEPMNDATFVGCLQLICDRQPVEVHQYGKVDKVITVYQATVEGHFKMEITAT